MKNPRTKRILLACGLAAGILFLALLCFYHLDYGELMDWDEARHGVSAYEMLQTGEPIVTTYAYSPDYWNLKPPLSEWLIALGYKLFGYNAYGLRIFSGVSMFLSALLCAAFLWKRYGKTEAVFSLFAFASWGIFATLLIGRHAWGWRGKRALRWTLAGFALLILAYVGSRFVAEVVLGRI